jgi:serine/threonine protein kinase
MFDRAGLTFKSGEAAAKMGDNERALGLLQRVPPSDEHYTQATELLADVFIRTGRPLLAMERLQKVLAGQPIAATNINLYYWFAAAYESAGKNEEALGIYKKIQAEDLHFRDVEKRVMKLLTGMSMPSLPGQGPLDRIGKYNVGAKIGQGAMGEVFRAHDPILKRDVALKMISATLAPESDLRRRFEQEAQSAAALNHPNIVTVYDYGQEQGRIYMAMEMLEGIDLRAAINRNSLLLLDQKLAVMEQIADGLAYAHSRNIIHRDLKPGNIFLLPTGQAKILDFGLAKLGTSEITQSGVILGTPNYMSPEQVRSAPVDARSDVFSLGAVFYELLSNRKAFDADSMQGVLYHVLNDEPDPVRTWVPDLPPEVVAVVEKALAKEPEKRYKNGAELRDAVKAARRSLSASVLAQAAPVRPRQSNPEAPTTPSAGRPSVTVVEGPSSAAVPAPPAAKTPPAAAAAAAPAPAPAGKGARFIPQEEIGRGPKGIVYRGGDATDGHNVALRFLEANVLKAPGALTSLAADLKAAAAVNHPNLVKLVGFVEIGGQRCVVTELVPGKSFAEPLRAGKRVPFAHALGIARVLAELLAAVHARGLVHGGVSPSNLMAAGTVVKLADLGLGRVFQGVTHAREYWPPEAKFEPATDLYAMAATLYHLVSGVVPPKATDRRPPSAMAPGVPAGFDSLLLRALDPEPGRRHPTAAAFIEALGTFGGRPPA